MLKVFGHPGSTCTRKVLMTLAETNTPFDLVTVELGKGEHKSEAHASRQPFGRIPAIDDDGFAMYESRAICRYLSRRAGSSLILSDLQSYARMEQWVSVETSEFAPHAMKFIYEHTFKRPQPAGALEETGKALDKACGVLDKQLARSPFLAGAGFSLADVFCMPYPECGMATPAKDMVGEDLRTPDVEEGARKNPKDRPASQWRTCCLDLSGLLDQHGAAPAQRLDVDFPLEHTFALENEPADCVTHDVDGAKRCAKAREHPRECPRLALVPSVDDERDGACLSHPIPEPSKAGAHSSPHR
jgi:glutathione S-transferase